MKVVISSAFMACAMAILFAAFASNARAAASASDAACNDSIATGNNGGSGFAAWTGVNANGSGGGAYTASDSSLNTGCGTTWGIYSASGTGPMNCQRSFTNSGALSVGQKITVDMQNGGIQTGGSEGLSLWNSSGSNVWELYFKGGSNFWTISDAVGEVTTTIPYAGSGCRAIFTLTSSTTYSFVAQVPVGGTTYGPFTGTLTNPLGGQGITQLRFFAYDIGANNNLQFNNINVTCPDSLSFTVQPQPQTAPTNVFAVFSVQTDGDSVAYQWQVNKGGGFANVTGSDGVGGASATFVTVATTPAMNGYQYKCLVTDACGNAATSTTNTLTVTGAVSAPSIGAEPNSTTTATVGSATPAMAVTAGSTDGSAPGYAWRKRGSGWGNAWTMDVNAGNIFLASSTNIDTGGQAWGLQQTAGTVATDAIRPLPAALGTNETISLDMDNKFVNTGGSVGISLQNNSGSNAFEFKFRGGDTDYDINDNRGNFQDTGVGFTSAGLHLDFTLTTTNTYSIRIKTLSNGTTCVLTGNTIGTNSIQRIRFFCYESGADNNIYFNNLAVAGADDNAGNYTAWSGTSAPDRGQKPLANGSTGNGSTYAGAGTSSFTIQNAQLADGTNSYDCAVMNGEGYATISTASALTVNKAVTGPTNTVGITSIANGTFQLSFTGTPGTNYVIQVTTNLIPPITWTNISTNIAGTNGQFQYIDLDATNHTFRFYRTGTQ